MDSCLDIIATVFANRQHMPYQIPTCSHMASVKRFFIKLKGFYPTICLFLLVKFNIMPIWTLRGRLGFRVGYYNLWVIIFHVWGAKYYSLFFGIYILGT